MSQLIVITFEDMHQAGEALEALKSIEKSELVTIDDAAVIVKEKNGKVHLKNQLDKGTKWGAVGGGLLGLMLAGLFFPVAGLVVGAVGGALIGKSMHLGVDRDFVKEVEAALEPGMSALFVIGSGNSEAVRATLSRFQGKVLQTTLDGEKLESLKQALKDDQQAG